MSFNIAELFDLEYWRQLLSVDVFSVPFFINILDILVVWYLVYKLIQMVQGTKAIQLFKGVVMFIAIRFLAEVIG
ncbi:MAG: TIGR00159 family protein, partial [Tetragenococcus koreensis]|nr:TIGR00159 family protein [Tetragenococcus koreensis]